MLVTHLIFNLATGAFAIYRNFKDAPKYISECSSGSEDSAVLKSCQDGAKLWKGVMIGVFILAWLIEICQFSYVLSLLLSMFIPCSISGACSIVHKYSKQLKEESATGMVKDTETW